MSIQASGNFYSNFANIWYGVAGFAPPPEDQAAENQKALENLALFSNKFLAKTKFIAGDSLSIADYKMVPMLYYLGHPAVKSQTGFTLV
jgi:glutathione S-transferase